MTGIACVDCGKPLLETAPMSPRAGAERRASLHTQIRAVAALHTCKTPRGHTMPTPDQCSRCDAVADCLDSGVTTLEDASGVIGCAAPQLHVHLIQHDRDDLLRRLTYGGEPILPPKTEPEPEVAEAEVAEAERSCQCDRWAFDPDEEGTHEAEVDGVIWLHTEEQCGPIEVDEPEAEDSADDVLDTIDAEIVAETIAEQERPTLDSLTDPVADHEVVRVLAWLAAHEDARVRETGRALEALLKQIADEDRARAELERLTVERDHLTARIEALRAQIGGTPAATPKPVAADPSAAELRAWARDAGIDCPATGRVPRHVLEAWRDAHEDAA